MSDMMMAALMIGGVGLFVGVFLGFASKAFAVAVDEKQVKIREVLPGANCGACGYTGCDALAAAIAKGEAPAGACVVGQEPVANQIAEIIGGLAGNAERKVAFVKCSGDCERTTERYDYSGPKSCVTVNLSPGGGPKSCSYGCIGCGDCVSVCEFGALSIQKGIAVVDEDKCKDCRKCMAACPKKLIIEIPHGRMPHIACSNPEKGKSVMSACKVGCITCGKCAKVCPAGAIDVTGGYPVVDYGKCIDCGMCVVNCPRGCIVGSGALKEA